MSFIDVASKSLITYQQMIATTGHNISNANTEGYSRQISNLSTQSATQMGGSYIGNGVKLDSVTRVFDQRSIDNIRSASSRLGESQITLQYINELNALISQSSTSPSVAVEDFFSSMEEVLSSPDSIASRNNLLSKAESVAYRFGLASSSIDDIKNSINSQVLSLVQDVNAIAGQIVNISKNLGPGNASPDLLDQRDQLVSELSKKINVTVISGNNNQLDILIGNGQPLVVGGSSISLQAIPSKSDPENLNVALSLNGVATDVSANLNGGELGGLMFMRDNVLSPAEDQIGYLAASISDIFNSQHKMGMDLTNQLGGDFFTDINSSAYLNSRIVDNLDNTGNAVLAANISDISQVEPTKYEFLVTGVSSYSLKKLSDNTTTTYASLPINVDGMSIQLSSGAMNIGDSFLIKPVSDAANVMKVNILDPEKIAIAAPVRTRFDGSNTGSGVIDFGSLSDATTTNFTANAGALSPPLQIEFLSSTSYQIVNMTTSAVIEGPIAYNPSVSNAIFPTPGSYEPGIRVDVSGTINAGDKFYVEYNTNGFNDNRNGLLLGEVKDTKIMNNNKSTLQGFYAEILTDVGNQVSQVSINEESSSILLQQAESKRLSISGVNLDEEAAKLLSLQQSYQASAELISVGVSLFQVLFDSI